MPRPDYWLIHKLEYELELRSDPPPVRRTDEPGAVIYYEPRHNSPTWIDGELWYVTDLRV